MHSLDVIVRFHDMARVAELDRCLFSVAMQEYGPVTVHLISQRFDPAALRALSDRVAPTLSLNPAVRLEMHNFTAPEPQHARTALLNAGLAAATGRYLAFLDHDDVIQAWAYRTLIAELAGSGYAIAFGRVQAKFVACSSRVSMTVDRRLGFVGDRLAQLFRENFCPIHGFVLDRSKIAASDLWFDETLHRNEDYDLLLRVCAKYPSSFRRMETIVGDHYIKDDGSNSSPWVASVTKAQQSAWDQAAEALQKRKRSIEVGLDVQRNMGLDPAPGRTVAEIGCTV